MAKTLFAVLWLAPAYWPGRAAWSQVVEVSGGASTLDSAAGGQVTVRGRDYAGNLGGGFIDGKAYAGGRVTREFEHSRISLGTEQIHFDLPTDIFEQGHYITGVGLGFSTASDRSTTFVFAGATANGFNTPFFSATDVEDPALIVRASDKDGGAEISALVLAAKVPTLLCSVEWKSDSGDTRVAGTTGVGAAKPYSAGSVSLHRTSFDLNAAYIASSPDFRRALVRTPLNSEPYRENVELVVRLTPQLGFTVSRQNFLTPVSNTADNTTSRVNQATVNARVAGVTLAATVSDSSDGVRSNLASFVNATRSVGQKTEIQVAYLRSQPDFASATSAFVSTVRQTVSPRWTASGVVNVASGQATLGAGGSFLSNVATVSLEYQTFYVPARVAAPFEQALISNVQLHLFGRVTLNETSFVAPGGRLLYTGGGDGLIVRPGRGNAASSGHNAIGRMVLRGRVLTAAGEPVAGAAVLVDELLVYTDSRGLFEVRERRAHPHRLAVAGESFLEGGHFHAVSAPALAWSGDNLQDGQEEIVVVERWPRGQGAGAS